MCILAHVGKFGGSAGPMLGLCRTKSLTSGLCSANFNPDLRKIRSGLNRTFFLTCPALLGLSCAKLGVYWAYLEAFGTSTPWLHFAISHQLKLNMTFFTFCWLKMRLSRDIVLDGANQRWMQKTISLYIYTHIYIYIYICIYIFV